MARVETVIREVLAELMVPTAVVLPTVEQVAVVEQVVVDMPAAKVVPPELLAEAQGLGLDLGGALTRLGGNSGVYLRMVRSFLKDVAVMPDQLAEHLQQGLRLDAGRLLHTLKGIAGTLGAKSLAVWAAQAEQRLKGLDSEESAGLPGDLVSALREVVTSTSTDLAQIAQALERVEHGAEVDRFVEGNAEDLIADPARRAAHLAVVGELDLAAGCAANGHALLALQLKPKVSARVPHVGEPAASYGASFAFTCASCSPVAMLSERLAALAGRAISD